MTQLPRISKHEVPQPCVMQVVRVSGTIRKAEEEAIKRARAAILRAKRESEEGSTDNLISVLNQANDNASRLAGKMKGRTTAGSDVSDGEDDIGVDSEDDGE